MRKMLMGSALLTLAIQCPAFAATDAQTGTDATTTQTTTQTTLPTHHVWHRHAAKQNGNNNGNGDQTADQGVRPGHIPGVGDSEPSSRHASNIDSRNTRSEIAPSLPSPQVGANASIDQYLQAANSAIESHRTGAAQEALERAETRLLDRVAQSGIAPEQSAPVMNLNEARRSLANGDMDGARRAIQDTMNSVQAMQTQPTQNNMAQTNGVNGMNGQPNGQPAGQMMGQYNNGQYNNGQTLGQNPTQMNGGQTVGGNPNSPYPQGQGMGAPSTTVAPTNNGAPINGMQAPASSQQ